MVPCAPRIDRRLRRLARRLARRGASAAEAHRGVGRYAERSGLVRPSYQQIRLLVNDARIDQAARRATAQLLLEVQLGTRSVRDLQRLLHE